MAHTDTNISNLKINRGTKAAIDANLSSIGENEIIFLTDKSVPIPADKVGAADSVDKGKVVSVNASGNYELTTPASPGMANPMTTQGDIIYGGASGAPTRLAKGTAGQVLKMNSGGTAPEWGADTAGMTNPMTTQGDIIYGGASGAPTALAKGTAGFLLAATSTVPVYTNSLPILTTAPSAANTDGGIKIVVLSAEPATKYSGYLYVIAPAQA